MDECEIGNPSATADVHSYLEKADRYSAKLPPPNSVADGAKQNHLEGTTALAVGLHMELGSPQFRRTLIFLFLVFLVTFSWGERFKNFLKSDSRTIDEIVYYRLARHLNESPPSYHACDYAKDLIEERGRKLPGYFTKPLFKHPPLVPVLMAAFLKIFGQSPISAYTISLLFGVAMIPLVYLLGSVLFDRRVGILAALLMYVEPINIICSQKLWLDTALAFFSVLALYLFVVGIKREKDNYFIASGVATGFAVLTKYPGMLSLFIIFLYAFLCRRELFKNKKFVLSLTLPFFMLLPWGYVNYRFYKFDFILKNETMHRFYSIFFSPGVILFILCLSAVSIVVFYKRFWHAPLEAKNGRLLKLGIRMLSLLAFLWMIQGAVIHIFSFSCLPETSWSHSAFHENLPWYFYFHQLVLFSPMYVLSYLAFFLFYEKKKQDSFFVKLSVVMILGFYVFWGNYQSRYILASIPFLVILAAAVWIKMFDFIVQQKNEGLKFLGQLALLLILVVIFWKTHYVNQLISFPHDMCYF